MTELWIKVKPGKDEFNVTKKTYLEIDLTEEPDNGRANQEMISKLEKRLGEKPAIISGHRSSRKKIKIPMDKDRIFQKLGVQDG